MKLTVAEMFAGVGGFRLGLEKSSRKWKTVWANQWEPSSKIQFAYDCYVYNFGEKNNCINENIENIVKKNIPDHSLLVGGFPCQDYSVARTRASGIQGKKGVLWWQIEKVIRAKKPAFLLLENVDRLLKSPSTQRGRDFGIMLYDLHTLGYDVEWRVINAADYGGTQKRRRTFIFGYRRSTNFAKQIKEKEYLGLIKRVFINGFFATNFPVHAHLERKRKKEEKYFSFTDKNNENYQNVSSLVEVSDNFSMPFYNSGIMIKGNVYTIQTQPVLEKFIPLENLISSDKIPNKYKLTKEQKEKVEHQKGSKRIPRIKPNGDAYWYSEGAMVFPDSLDQPARTMLTSEGTLNRSTHFVKDVRTKRIRFITPLEAERINGFTDDWTKYGKKENEIYELTDRQRYFCMGNALVVPLIEKMGKAIKKIIEEEK